MMTLGKTTGIGSTEVANEAPISAVSKKVGAKSRVQEPVAAFHGPTEDGRSAKAADVALSTNNVGRSDVANGHGCSHNQCCTSPIKHWFSTDEYHTLGVTSLADVLHEASKVLKALNKQLSFSHGSVSSSGASSPSCTYSGDQSYSAYLDTEDDTIAIDGRPLAERIIANRARSAVCTQASCSYTDTAPSIDEPLLGDISQPKFYFAANFQDNILVVHTSNACSCHSNCRPTTNFQADQPIVHPSSCSRSTGSVNSIEDSFVEMQVPHKSVGSDSSMSSSSKSTLADTLVDSLLESRIGDKTVSFSNWTSADTEAPMNTREADSDTEQVLTKGGLRHLVEAKIQDLRLATGSVRTYPNPSNRRSWTHPNHLREWHSKNLWCACCQGICAVCQAPCCAYFGAWKVYNDKALPLENRSWAYELLKELPRWKNVGTDEATFMDCTSCHKLICPHCCGICPRYPCNDRCCKICKVEPWEPCDFHENT